MDAVNCDFTILLLPGTLNRIGMPNRGCGKRHPVLLATDSLK